MRTLSVAEARRIQLGRQGLLTPFRDPFEAVRAMVAVQTQYAASLPVAVAVRTRRPKPGWDERALIPGGEIVKSWSLRHTLHAHLREDHALILGSIGEWWYRRHAKWLTEEQGLDLASIEEKTLAALAEGPLSREELHARVPEVRAIPHAGWGRDVAGLAFRRRLCVVGRGATQCFAALSPEEVAADLGALFVRYVGAYGPASFRDFAHWVGLPQQELRGVVESVGDRVEAVRVEGFAEDRFVPAGTEVPSGPLGVRLLAKFDPLVLSHRDKTLWLAEEDRTRVFRIAAQVEAVVLSQGRAIGTWRLERKAKTTLFHVEPFRPLKAREWEGIEKEAARMARNLGFPEATVFER
ncbi:MAG: winged helix DNA-binding domain-containing protein [Fimbriimonas sp.]